MDERTIVYMSDNPKHVLEAYVNSGEGLDCAGGINVAVSLSFVSLCLDCSVSFDANRQTVPYS
jgi:hypothetical protein